jgi:flagellar biosynthetic protein FliR
MDASEWLLTAARFFGMGTVAPFFSSRLLPLRLRLGLLLLLAMAGAARARWPVGLAAPSPGELGELLWPLGGELLIGCLLGWSSCLVLAAVRGAAVLLMEQLGLPGFSTPEAGALEGLPLQGLYDGLALFLFLGLDLHLELLATAAESFSAIPPGSLGREGVLPAFGALLQAVGPGAFQAALILAVPVAASLLAATVVQAILTRAVPDLDFFAFGLALRAAIGLALVWGTLPLFTQVCQRALRSAALDGASILQVLGG